MEDSLVKHYHDNNESPKLSVNMVTYPHVFTHTYDINDRHVTDTNVIHDPLSQDNLM